MPADFPFFFRCCRFPGAATFLSLYPETYQKLGSFREGVTHLFGRIAKQHSRQLFVAALCLTFLLLAPPVHAQETSPLAAPLITTPTSPPPNAPPTATPVILVVAPADATPAASDAPLPDNPLSAPESIAEPAPSSFWPLAVQIFEAAVRSLAWLWFACGSLVFFVTAGIFAGLGLQRQPRGRYALLALPDHDTLNSFAPEGAPLDEFALGNFALSENRPLTDKEFARPRTETEGPRRTSPAKSSPSKSKATDDYWPASLP